jgi:hypothetical protein
MWSESLTRDTRGRSQVGLAGQIVHGIRGVAGSFIGGWLPPQLGIP